MKRAYNWATHLLVSSRAESFCHPILEAFSTGVLVVMASDLPVAKEIAVDCAVEALPTGPAFADAVEQLQDDEALSSSLRAKAFSRSREFSWERTAKETADFILSVARTR